MLLHAIAMRGGNFIFCNFVRKKCEIVELDSVIPKIQFLYPSLSNFALFFLQEVYSFLGQQKENNAKNWNGKN